jgi:hypothetical protein
MERRLCYKTRFLLEMVYGTAGFKYKFIIESTQTLEFHGSIDNVSVKLARAEEVEAVKCLADWIHTTALQDLNN